MLYALNGVKIGTFEKSFWTWPYFFLLLQWKNNKGAGGQNVNKVSSAVCLKLDLSPESTSCLWIPEDVRERLIQQQASRINKAGELTLHVQAHRTQVANRKAAVLRLKLMIQLAWNAPKVREMKTGISQNTKDRRKEEKRRRGQIKASRRPPDDW